VHEHEHEHEFGHEHVHDRGRVYGRAAGAWLAMLAVMSANGVLREALLVPRLGEHAGRQVSSVLGACLVVALSGVFVARFTDPRRAPLARIGLLWGALTLAFEFGFGHYVSGLAWDALLADYDVAAGRLWPLVLAATVLSPPLWGLRLR
jgi:hypothetical protein